MHSLLSDILYQNHLQTDRTLIFVFCGQILHWCLWMDNTNKSSIVSLVGNKQVWPLVWGHTIPVWISHILNLLKPSLRDHTILLCPTGSTCMGLAYILTCTWWYIKIILLGHISGIELLLLHIIPHFWPRVYFISKNLWVTQCQVHNPVCLFLLPNVFRTDQF